MYSRKVMNLKYPILVAAVMLLSGCTLDFETSFEGLSMVREEPPDIVAQHSLPGKEMPFVPLTGMLRLDFASDTDLAKLRENDGYHTGFDATICGSGEEMMAWGEIYQNTTVPTDADDRHHYSVFLITSWPDYDYNLKLKPESICVQFRAGKMVTLFSYRSNIFVVDREQVIRAFEEKP